MLYIYFPNAILLMFWLYIMNFNLLLSLFLAPVTYLISIGYLLYKQQFNYANIILDKLIVTTYIEEVLIRIVDTLIYLVFLLPYVKKLYLILKVKILVYLFNLVVSYIPQQQTNHLTEELQNDYLAILNKNKRKRAASLEMEKLENKLDENKVE